MFSGGLGEGGGFSETPSMVGEQAEAVKYVSLICERLRNLTLWFVLQIVFHRLFLVYLLFHLNLWFILIP